MEAFTVDGATARLHREGPEGGRPLLYLHSGFGEAGALPLFAELASLGFRVTAPELPGYGTSEPCLWWRGIEDAVFHLRRTLDVLLLECPLVVGSSIGGWLAAELAVWFPERVEGLVLVDAVGLRIEGAPIFDFFSARQGETMRRALPHGGDLLGLLAPAIDGDDPQGPLLHLFHASEATARLGWNPFLHDPLLAGRLHLVDAPTLVVHGADDGIVPLAHSEAYAGAIDGARLEVLAHCGHLPALEQPEALAKLVGSLGA